jgi:hypothetical protein
LAQRLQVQGAAFRFLSEVYVMDGWLASTFERLRTEWRIKCESGRIARKIYPALWESVRRKITDTTAIENDLIAYAKVRAAQLAQEHVDAIMKVNPALSGIFATELLLTTTDRAVNSVLKAVANARRPAA